MIRYLLIFVLINSISLVNAQIRQGKVIYDSLYSAVLINTGGEESTRGIAIYLPPGYDESKDRYPVIYYLHGITQRDTLMSEFDLNELMDKAIATGKIRPVILVLPDEYTLYRGSFYTNSDLTGKWADFTAKELVSYIDQKYRTIVNKESRGLAGHSMVDMEHLN